MRGFSEDEFSTALAEALRYFKYDSLKVEQTECIRRVICLWEDVLAVLPTGFGKSLIQIRIFSLESLVPFVLFLAVLEEYPSPSLDLVWSRLENDFHVTFCRL